MKPCTIYSITITCTILLIVKKTIAVRGCGVTCSLFCDAWVYFLDSDRSGWIRPHSKHRSHRVGTRNLNIVSNNIQWIGSLGSSGFLFHRIQDRATSANSVGEYTMVSRPALSLERNSPRLSHFLVFRLFF